MSMTLPQLNRYFLLLTAPFLGAMIWLLSMNTSFAIVTHSSAQLSTFHLQDQLAPIGAKLEYARKQAVSIEASINRFFRNYNKTNEDMQKIVKVASTQAHRPSLIYDRRISSRLGRSIEQVQSERIDLSLYRIHESTYDGYAMKVKLKSPSAMKMVLGKDKLGASETTLSAVRRTGAVAGINAGGFADQQGSRYPLGTTVLRSKYVGGFKPTYENLFFVGLNKEGKLIGGNFSEQADLDRLQPQFGASFVPILLKNGIKLEIPPKWISSPKRAPRTIIANYKDNQLLIVVTDGYDERGNSGATLLELQSKLKALGVRDAYNLDGGGSSSLIVGGHVINSPSDGRLRPVATHFLFFK